MYRPWNSRWKRRLRRSTSVSPATSASALVKAVKCQAMKRSGTTCLKTWP
jgi:ribosomal protein L32